MAKHTKPLTPSESKAFNVQKKIKSDARIKKRETERSNRRKPGTASAGKPAPEKVRKARKAAPEKSTEETPSRKKRVTTDLRKEVAKGSKASGVAVNGKMVRRGKVKAAEKVVRKAIIKKVAKKAIPGVAAVGFAIAATKFVTEFKKERKRAATASKFSGKRK